MHRPVHRLDHARQVLPGRVARNRRGAPHARHDPASGAPPGGATGCSRRWTARSSVELIVYTLPAFGPGSAGRPASSSAAVAAHVRNVRRSSPPLTSRCSHGSIWISRSPASYRRRVPGTVPGTVSSLTTPVAHPSPYWSSSSWRGRGSGQWARVRRSRERRPATHVDGVHVFERALRRARRWRKGARGAGGARAVGRRAHAASGGPRRPRSLGGLRTPKELSTSSRIPPPVKEALCRL